MKVIPAIDLMDGSVVRLSEGDFSTCKGYSTDPVAVAKIFEEGGLSALHVVDLDAARGRGSNIKVLERIASSTALEIDFGGGMRSEDDIARAFDAGACKVNLGSIAVKDRESTEQWGRKYSGRIILSADARNGIVAMSGWQEDTGIQLLPFLRDYIESGICTAVVTDIAKDGMLQGPSFELYGKIISALPDIHLIASGGVSSPADLWRLSEIGCSGAIVGKAFYEGRITIKEMKEAECLRRG